MSLHVETVQPMNIDRTWVYSAKFICGLVNPIPGANPPAPADGAPLGPGLYLTAINIYNPNDHAAEFVKRGVVAFPQHTKRFDKPRNPTPERLDPHLGIEVDCLDFLHLLGEALTEPAFDFKHPFLKGFVEVRTLPGSPQLAVVAVYTVTRFTV
jgi:hypothetical protein